MKRIITALSLLALTPCAASAAVPLQRYTLVIGANFGGADRPRLQYAVADAERFARVMIDLGGVTPANQIVLRQPSLPDLVGALTRLSARVDEGRRIAAAGGGGRIEVLLYYSGHADEQGLLLGSDRYSYRTLRDRLDAIPADVRIAVLDACASGAFTRLKGGRARPPFLVDESADMRGHAFLTSSADTESAQESDRIRASYFTHFLISGFRGAADLSGDGKVTLNEAYQFAFSETLRRTVDTRGGAQHPSFDINLSGTGDVVMTDVRQTTATLVLDEDVEGRFFVRTASQELVVELYKPAGRIVSLGVEPGSYEVRLERAKESLLAKTQVPDGGRVVLAARQFGPAALERTVARGGAIEAPKFALGGRNRIAARVGVRNGPNDTSTSGFGLDYLLAGAQYTRFFDERFSITAGADVLAAENGTTIDPDLVFTGSESAVGIPIGFRWNPLVESTRVGSAKPFLTGGIMPVFSASTGTAIYQGRVLSGGRTGATVGAFGGGGIDILIVPTWSLGVDANYTWVPGLSRIVGSRRHYGGPEVAVSVGWLFGRGDSPSR